MEVGLETNLTEKILDHFRKLRHKAIKIHVDQYQEAGTPDIFACVNGRLFVIEVKKIGEEPTNIQKYRLFEWRESGALTLVADNMDTVLMGLEIIGENHGENRKAVCAPCPCCGR